MPKSAKGGAFEREICKAMSLWWTKGKRDDVFVLWGHEYGRDFILGKFVSKIAVLEKESCWLWQGSVRNNEPRFNYGNVWLPGVGNVLAHRISLSLFLDRDLMDPKLGEVLHSCDNPLCCNPHHLRLGSHAENMRDRSARHRWNPERGEDRYNAKLNPRRVRCIRLEASVGATQTELSRSYGVDRALVRRVVLHESWRHVK